MQLFATGKPSKGINIIYAFDSTHEKYAVWITAVLMSFYSTGVAEFIDLGRR